MLKLLFKQLWFRHLLVLTCLVFYAPDCAAQKNKSIDSLLTELNKSKEDTNKVNKLNDMSAQLRSFVQFADSRKYADSALALAQKINFSSGIARAYNNIGNALITQGKYAEALKNYFASLKKKEEAGDKTDIASSYTNIGSAYGFQGNYVEALKYFLASLRIRERIGDKKGTAICYQNIGVLFYRQGNYKDALENYMASLKIFEEIRNKQGIADCYSLMGVVYKNLGNYPEALKNLQISWTVGKEIKNVLYNFPYNAFGDVYYSMGNYSEASKNYLAALKLAKEIGDDAGVANCYIDIANLNLKLHKPLEAKKYLDSGLALSLGVGDKELVATTYKILSIIDSAIGNYHQSLEHYKLYTLYKDSMLNETNSKQISQMKEQYESEKKDREIIKLASEKQKLEDEKKITALFIKTKEDSLNLVTSEKEKMRIDNERIQALNLYNQQQLELLAKEKQLQQLKLEKNQADLLAQRAETNKRQTDYLFQKSETEKRTNELILAANLRQLQDLELKKQKQTKNYLLGGVALMLVLSFFVYRNYQVKQQLKLQALRNKIASDLHDDVGSTLSSISIFSELAKQQSNEVLPLLDTIGESSRKMLDAMGDIVWTINPENDQFEKIVSRMKSFAYELLGARNIDFEFVADEDITRLKLPMEVRKNLYLIFKEATNNMVKYSNASKAMFAIKGEKDNLTLLIKDDGSGFDISRSSEGNGLKNMKRRAEEIGGELRIQSYPGNGTTIQLKLAV